MGKISKSGRARASRPSSYSPRASWHGAHQEGPHQRKKRVKGLEWALLLAIAAFGGLCYDQYRDGAGIWGGNAPVAERVGTPDLAVPEERRDFSSQSRETSAPEQPARDEPQARKLAWGSAVRVVDGDTFWYEGEKIRVADIDTPEMRGRCPYETRLAAKAAQRMRALLNEGPFELQPLPDRDEDQYGRKLRVVTRNGHSLGDQLVGEGLARTWTGRREPWC